jgi:hypothetical protein
VVLEDAGLRGRANDRIEAGSISALGTNADSTDIRYCEVSFGAILFCFQLPGSNSQSHFHNTAWLHLPKIRLPTGGLGQCESRNVALEPKAERAERRRPTRVQSVPRLNSL